MKDVVSKYKKKSRLNTVFIIWASLALAVVINATFSDNNFARFMRTSIADSNNLTQKADVYSEVESWVDKTIIYVKNSKNLNQVTNISLSFSFDPEKTDLKTVFSYLKGSEVIKNENTPWFATVFINFKKPINISKDKKILDIIVTKDEDTINDINLSNVNFKDTDWNNYELSSSWISF